MVLISTRIPEELKNALKKRAAENKRTVSGELYAILDDLLKPKIPAYPIPATPIVPPFYKD